MIGNKVNRSSYIKKWINCVIWREKYARTAWYCDHFKRIFTFETLKLENLGNLRALLRTLCYHICDCTRDRNEAVQRGHSPRSAHQVCVHEASQKRWKYWVNILQVPAPMFKQNRSHFPFIVSKKLDTSCYSSFRRFIFREYRKIRDSVESFHRLSS